jgi:two-component system, OmpR family, sensor histidine kinase MprB
VTFRAKLTLVATGAVAAAIVLASALLFVVVRDQLYSGIDNSLRDDAGIIAGIRGRDFTDAFYNAPGLVLSGAYPQLVKADGETYKPDGPFVSLPVDARTLDVARTDDAIYYRSTTVAGRRVRIVALHYPSPYAQIAIQVARPLEDVDRAVDRTRTILFFAGLAGIGLAAILGLFVSGAAVAPIRRLMRATESVAETGDLSQRIEVTGRDELSQLAVRFNEMLAALEESTRAQQQLVADASHELRTPLTSLRTNIEVLARDRPLPPGERERLIADVLEQLGEMTAIITELMELARGEQHIGEPEDVRLDLVTQAAVERVQRNRPSVVFDTDLHETPMRGVPATLERAIGNLLDNAAKWSPPGGTVEVTVRDGEVTVRDHGPGIAEEDMPYVFDRFYRAKSARGMPGSGLGLAIVRQVAEAHGGQVWAEAAEGGGTVMHFRVGPTAPWKHALSEVTAVS